MSISTTVKVDTTAPTGGAITANGSGSASFNTTGTISLSKTDFTDADSGIASNVITRATASLTGNSCGSFSGATVVTISGGNDPASLTTACYQYTLTGTNNARQHGDRDERDRRRSTRPPPTGGAITANGSGSDSFNTTGTVSLSKTDFTDPIRAWRRT